MIRSTRVKAPSEAAERHFHHARRRPSRPIEPVPTGCPAADTVPTQAFAWRDGRSNICRPSDGLILRINRGADVVGTVTVRRPATQPPSVSSATPPRRSASPASTTPPSTAPAAPPRNPSSTTTSPPSPPPSFAPTLSHSSTTLRTSPSSSRSPSPCLERLPA